MDLTKRKQITYSKVYQDTYESLKDSGTQTTILKF